VAGRGLPDYLDPKIVCIEHYMPKGMPILPHLRQPERKTEMTASDLRPKFPRRLARPDHHGVDSRSFAAVLLKF
jgi:hypothetical protein